MFAAQDVLSNFVAGICILQDWNFNIDDWIEWDDRAGFIEDIGFRVTRVRTFDTETVTVPNTELATAAVTNRMSNETLRISTTFGIGYGNVIDEATRRRPLSGDGDRPQHDHPARPLGRAHRRGTDGLTVGASPASRRPRDRTPRSRPGAPHRCRSRRRVCPATGHNAGGFNFCGEGANSPSSTERPEGSQ